MSRDKNQAITLVLRMLAKKGTYDVLVYIGDNECGVHYNEVQKFTMDRRLFKSRASVTTILNDLTDHGLLDRKVIGDRPLRVLYYVNERGSKVIKHLDEIEKLAKKQ